MLKGRDAQKLLHCLHRVIGLHLLGIVVFVFDANVASFILIFIFVFKVVTAGGMSVKSQKVITEKGTHSSSPESCMKSSSDILAAPRRRFESGYQEKSKGEKRKWNGVVVEKVAGSWRSWGEGGGRSCPPSLITVGEPVRVRGRGTNFVRNNEEQRECFRPQKTIDEIQPSS